MAMEPFDIQKKRLRRTARGLLWDALIHFLRSCWLAIRGQHDKSEQERLMMNYYLNRYEECIYLIDRNER